MKERVFVAFNPAPREWTEVRELLLLMGLADLAKSGPKPWGYHVTLPADSPKLETIRSVLDAADLQPFERLGRHYSESELRTFPLVRLAVQRSPSGYGGPTYGTAYDLANACPSCGTGAVQTSALYLRRSELKKTGDIFETLDGELLCSPSLAEELQRSLADVELRQTVDARTVEKLPWFQLLATREMPPVHPATEGLVREKPCPHCERDGYFHSSRHPLELVYERHAIEDLPDAASTYERFGNSALRQPLSESHFAQPMILVGPRLLDIVRRLRVRSLDFEPVRFI